MSVFAAEYRDEVLIDEYEIRRRAMSGNREPFRRDRRALGSRPAEWCNSVSPEGV